MIVSAEVVALIAAGVAVFAAVLAVRAAALVARSLIGDAAAPARSDRSSPRGAADAEVAETREGPRETTERLLVRVTEAHTKRDVAADTRDYAFVLTAVNPTGGPRRLTNPTLRVTYRTRANFLGAVDLSCDDVIDLPAGISRAATLRFTTSNLIPRHSRIDAYTLLFLDDAGGRLMVDASLPAVLQADTDGTGPKTWGWD